MGTEERLAQLLRDADAAVPPAAAPPITAATLRARARQRQRRRAAVAGLLLLGALALVPAWPASSPQSPSAAPTVEGALAEVRAASVGLARGTALAVDAAAAAAARAVERAAAAALWSAEVLGATAASPDAALLGVVQHLPATDAAERARALLAGRDAQAEGPTTESRPKRREDRR